MNATAHPKQIGIHLRVPAMGLMAKMHAGFQELAHGEGGDFCHGSVSLIRLYHREPQARPLGPAPDQ